MNIAIVDDNDFDLINTKKLITNEAEKRFLNINSIDVFKDSHDFLSKFCHGKYDIIILDIFIDDNNGIDIAQKIRESDNDVIIVLLSSSNEFATESYHAKVNWYLKKPATQKNISDMFDALHIDRLKEYSHVYLPNGTLILPNNLIHTDYNNHIVTFFMKNNNTIQVRMSFSEAASLLENYEYIYSPITGCLINFFEVSDMENNVFIMSDKTRVPIAVRKTKEAKEAYMRFCFEQMKKEVHY
ncbi:response regulator [Howardella ureilytica]